MNKILKVKLPKGWSDHSSEYPDGPATFIRDISKDPGVIQVSFAMYESGVIPNPSYETLIELAKKVGENIPAGDLIETLSGECRFGKFGTAIFHSKEFSRTQTWYLSDGHDFILATYISVGSPTFEEVAEARRVVTNLRIVKKPFWRLQ